MPEAVCAVISQVFYKKYVQRFGRPAIVASCMEGVSELLILKAED
jgi:hypothetical protein